MTEKSKILSIRFTPNALDWIVRQAREVGVSKGRYIRKVVLGELPPAKVPFGTNQRSLKLADDITHREMRRMVFRQLPMVGNNLNQLTKKVNCADEFTKQEREQIMIDIKVCRQDLDQLSIKIMEAIL
ncbi:plasmid mobilization protein [Fodinibius sediminis]|uniref:Mobilisation protein (MobC) n=1 Tax=Fodinibius sediminis TaxID=1214077 RepID=A0A521CBW5_9BACT|nr:plasmid mobilization relaxosome protein MobC [Fodinibius sediminis]SMO56894.1 mobilisation protein (MobC) [Fodinibius sediminis]